MNMENDDSQEPAHLDSEAVRNHERLRTEAEQYRGQYIAWSMDCSRIVAHAADLRVLDDLVREAGYDPSNMLIEALDVEETKFPPRFSEN